MTYSRVLLAILAAFCIAGLWKKSRKLGAKYRRQQKVVTNNNVLGEQEINPQSFWAAEIQSLNTSQMQVQQRRGESKANAPPPSAPSEEHTHLPERFPQTISNHNVLN